jgi:ribosomal protein L12E/L44/L45/RPP1/RPP2
MAIDSVTSTISAYVNSGAQAGKSQQAQQAQQAQQPETREPRPEERVERKEEPPRPVVNAQGQQTGTLINVIA